VDGRSMGHRGDGLDIDENVYRLHLRYCTGKDHSYGFLT
jgi:hypothetical protein